MSNQLCDDMELTAEKELTELLNENQNGSDVDIDAILNDKAKKNQLTKTNVKNLIKNVLMNEDVATMLRQTLADDGDRNCLYEPKLTRGKIREMLKSYPPSAQQWSSNQQNSIISECRLLIEKEFPDDSEDEEYRPDKNLEDDEEEEYDEDESKFSEANKSFGTDGDVENNVDNNSVLCLNDKETIGMRTRSKLSLNDTPLETIEQAFIPPDITEDMYDSACENDEWMEFLSEFTKPLESVQNDDVDEDPEYNVLSDDEFTSVDKEEFRIDKSVKITRKEYNDLMDELYEFTESYNEMNAVETHNKDTVNTKNTKEKTIVKVKNYQNSKPSPNCTTNVVEAEVVSYDSTQFEKQLCISLFNNVQQSISDQKKINDMLPSTSSTTSILNFEPKKITTKKRPSVPKKKTVPCEECGMTSKQMILFKQQLTQHIQLITQTYLLSTMDPTFKKNCKRLKHMLEVIRDKSNDKIFMPINIHTSFSFIEDWNEVFYTDNTDTNSIGDFIILPTNVKEFMLFYDKPLFLYPELLPSRTFRQKCLTRPLAHAEEKLLVMKIASVYTKLKEAVRSKYTNSTVSDIMPIIIKTVHRRWFSHRRLTDLKNYITRRTNTYEINLIKNYVTNNIIEDTVHVVDIGALMNGKCLYEYNIKKFPLSWRTLLKKLELTNKIK